MDYSKHIADFDLPYPDLVLEEIFFIPANDHLPGTRRPVTVSDLADISGRTPEVVWHHLHEIEKASRGVVLESSAACLDKLIQLQQSGQKPYLFDVRFASKVTADPIADALHLPSMTSPQWQSVFGVKGSGFTFSDNGRKAFSAAMWLRTQGRPHAFSVKTTDLRHALATLLTLVLFVLSSGSSALVIDGESFQLRPGSGCRPGNLAGIGMPVLVAGSLPVSAIRSKKRSRIF